MRWNHQLGKSTQPPFWPPFLCCKIQYVSDNTEGSSVYDNVYEFCDWSEVGVFHLRHTASQRRHCAVLLQHFLCKCNKVRSQDPTDSCFSEAQDAAVAFPSLSARRLILESQPPDRLSQICRLNFFCCAL